MWMAGFSLALGLIDSTYSSRAGSHDGPPQIVHLLTGNTEKQSETDTVFEGIMSRSFGAELVAV